MRRFNEVSHLCPTSNGEVGHRKAAPILGLSHLSHVSHYLLTYARTRTRARARTCVCVFLVGQVGQVGHNKQWRGVSWHHLLSHLSEVGHFGGATCH